jgi:hypothetical protein
MSYDDRGLLMALSSCSNLFLSKRADINHIGANIGQGAEIYATVLSGMYPRSRVHPKRALSNHPLREAEAVGEFSRSHREFETVIEHVHLVAVYLSGWPINRCTCLT